MRRPTRVLLANVDPCGAEKLRRTCHGVDLVCSRSAIAHRRTNDAIPSHFPAEFCHLLVKTLLMAGAHAMFSYILPNFFLTHP